jgi:transcription elongation GreA/GreB family factor
VATPDKASLLQELTTVLRRERDIVQSAQREAQQAVTHEESRAESDKDMRSTEASYLARGQAERVVALDRDVLLVERMLLASFGDGDAIAVSALVELRADDGRRSTVFLAPAGGGTRLRDGTVRVVTPSSPLGVALVGAARGEHVVVEQGDRELGYEIIAVS